LAEQLDAFVRGGRPDGVGKIRNETIALHEEDPPQIRARQVESHAAERTGLYSDDLRDFYEVAPHIAATFFSLPTPYRGGRVSRL
jgi:hypothetical protein